MKQAAIPINLNIYSRAESTLAKDSGFFIGAATTFGVLSRHPTIEEYPALHMALRNLTTPQSRQGKSVGRILYQDMEAQGVAAALVALDADMVIRGKYRERSIKLAHFFTREGSLAADESVNGFYLVPAARQASVYQSIDYLRSGQAVCGVAAWAVRTQDTLEKVRIVLSGCTPYPVPLLRISASLQGRECTLAAIEEATLKLGEERLLLYNPHLTLGSHLFNLSKTLIKRAMLTL